MSRRSCTRIDRKPWASTRKRDTLPWSTAQLTGAASAVALASGAR